MNWRLGAGLHLAVLAGYVATALAFSWPLALHLGTNLTGPPDGDTGVYVWNQWVFQHEILEQGRFPYFTDKIFSLTGRANLSHHNYMIATFWWTLLWLALTSPLFLLIVLPGAIAWTVVGLWYLYRCIRDWLRFNDGQPPP